MKFSEIGTALADLSSKVKEMAGKIAGIEAKTVAPVTAEALAALTAELATVKAGQGAIESSLVAATTALTETTNTISTLQTELATTKAELSNKKKIAEDGAAAAAELAAGQGTASLPAKTDADASGKSAGEVLQGQMKTATDPKVKMDLARKARALRGVSIDGPNWQKAA